MGNLFDYQKLNLDENILMSLVQFNNGLFICSGIEFYVYIKELRGTTDSMSEKCQNIGRVDLTSQQLTQLRNDFKNFGLVLFDRWRAPTFIQLQPGEKTISNTKNTINGQNIG